MKSLKEHILEGILDIEDNINIDSSEITKDVIEQFLKENYKIRDSYTIKETKNVFTVDVKGNAEVKNKNITSLTNGLFEFGKVEKGFNCSECRLLTSLEGSPKEVGWSFNCSYCKSLKTLEGSPEKIGESFYCNNCKSLKSIEGAPKEVKWSFNCSGCESLLSLKGAPEKVGETFYCNNCKSLKSLEGAPQKVGASFHCNDCGVKFNTEDVKKYTTVNGVILT